MRMPLWYRLAISFLSTSPFATSAQQAVPRAGDVYSIESEIQRPTDQTGPLNARQRMRMSTESSMLISAKVVFAASIQQAVQRAGDV